MFKHRCLFICLFFLSFACLLVCFRHFFSSPRVLVKSREKKRAKCNNPKKKGRGTDSAHSKQAGEKKEHSIKEQLIFAFTTNSNEEVFCLRLCSTCRLVMCATGKKGKTERIRVLRAYAKGKRTCPPSPSCSMPFFCCCCFYVFVSLKSASNSSPKLWIESGTPGQLFHAFFYLFYDSSSANVRICTQASKQYVNNTKRSRKLSIIFCHFTTFLPSIASFEEQ